MKHKNIAICYGQNCRDVGGTTLAKELKALNIVFEIIPCQSLCTYAPTAKVDHVAVLHASVGKLADG